MKADTSIPKGDGTIAIAGVSRKQRGFGWTLFDDMRKRGFPVVPVNPGTEEIDGQRCYARASDIEPTPALLVVVVPRQAAVEVVRDAVGAGVPRVWMQPGSDSDAAAAVAREAGAEIVTGQCMFLHLEPVRGIHAVHRFIARLFGKV